MSRVGAIMAAVLVVIGGLALTVSPTAATGDQRFSWSPWAANSGPPAVSYAAAAYDSDNGTLVLFGGVKANGTLSDDTWVWDGSSWTDYPGNQIPAPAKRQKAAMAFDPGLHQLILFGGLDATGHGLFDTWAWNGLSWYEEVSHDVPSPRYGAGLAYDGSGDLVLFGGVSNTAWSGATSTTTSSSSTSTATAASSTSSTSATTTAGIPIELGDTWLWTPLGWVRSETPAPPARDGAVMTWDSTTHEVVLFSGSRGNTLLGDTWVWYHSKWLKQAPKLSPPARSYAASFDEPAAKAVALFGGASGHTALGDMWMWTGKTWAAAPAPGAPPARIGAAAAFLSSLSEGFVFGGATGSGQILGDGWILTLEATAPPATTTTTTTSTTSVPPANPSSSTTRPKPPPTRSTTTAVTSPAVTIPRAGAGQGTISVHRGQRILLTGSGFRPGSDVVITFHSASMYLGTVTAADNGTVQAQVAVPSTAAGGTHHFEESGPTPSGRISDIFTAVQVVGVPGSNTTSTGETAILVAVAILLPAGAWLIMSGADRLRRRGRRAG